MLGVAPCPDGGCPKCGAKGEGHYYTCPDNPAIRQKERLRLEREDLEAARRIDSAQKRLAGFHGTVH